MQTFEIILESVVLFAFILPVLRLIVLPGFRARMLGLVRFSLLLCLLLVAYLCSIPLFALFAPPLLRLETLLVLALWLYLYWRARPDYGIARGLPRGSLALIPAAPWHDPQFYLKQVAAYGPIFKSSDLFQPCICIVGLAQGREFLSRHQANILNPPLAMNRFVPRSLLRYTNAANHTMYRPILQSAFPDHVLGTNEPLLLESICHTLSQMASDSAARPDRGVSPEPYIHDLIFSCLATLFFGMSPSSEHFSRLAALYHIIDYRASTQLSDRPILLALDELTLLLQHRVECAQAAASSSAPQPSFFLAEMVRAHPEALNDPTSVRNLIYMLIVARYDLTGLALWLLKFLSDNPQWAAQLRETPPHTHAGVLPLSKRIVLETLRMEQSSFILRRTTSEIQFSGYTIPKNWYVRICTHESHRDPNTFPAPDTFNPDRFLHHHFTRSEYSPFGAFQRTCLGQDLTVNFSALLVQQLAQHFTWSVTRDDKPELIRFHWQPSSKFRIALTPLPNGALYADA